MYICNLCGGEFPYLIFEYNAIVCEKCSIRKNVTNCAELDLKPIELEFAENREKYEDVEDKDAEQLLDVIERIENPQIRKDFMDLAEQYLQGY